MKSLKLTILALMVGANAQAADLMKDFDSLGGNDVLLEKAKALNPDTTISIVQDRIVPRRKRLELAPEFSTVVGGDSYNKTSEFGLNAQFHITPRWSIGAKYTMANNTLSPEGEYLLEDVSATGKPQIPDIDYPKNQVLGLLNWYPIYGKMNLLDKGVAHFDVYLLGGGGQVTLRSGTTSTYTAGGGIGIWWSQHLTTRAELRYQTYNAKRYDRETPMNLTIAGLQIGYML
ncbi:MAG: outer membrane beta-barrel domain-containing protein [Bdellovibrionota bacterium]